MRHTLEHIDGREPETFDSFAAAATRAKELYPPFSKMDRTASGGFRFRGVNAQGELRVMYVIQPEDPVVRYVWQELRSARTDEPN